MQRKSKRQGQPLSPGRNLDMRKTQRVVGSAKMLSGLIKRDKKEWLI